MSRPACFFATGTGRCGSMWLARFLDAQQGCACVHEQSATYALLSEAWRSGDPAPMYPDAFSRIHASLAAAQSNATLWGEVSALLYFLLPEIERRFAGQGVKYILQTRRAADFARFAMARGFFTPEHPHGLQHALPPKDSKTATLWPKWGALEKCLWYWREVNSYVLRFFAALDAPERCMVLRLEDFSPATCNTLLTFLGLPEQDTASLQSMLKRPVNRTPSANQPINEETPESWNPWSQEAPPPFEQWPSAWRQAWEELAQPLEQTLYPEEC